MKSSRRLVSIVVCFAAAACTKRPLDARGKADSGGIDFTAPDASIVDAAADVVAPRDLLTRDYAEALACASHDDCVATWYPQAVTSTADCYCGTCALWPLNKTADALFAAQWEQYCRAWAATADCPIIPCPRAPKVACVAGVCTAGSFGVPTSCRIDPTSGCGNAIACRGTCCAPGEWCDDRIGCRCGYNLSCPLGQTCGQSYASNSGKGLCGDICCFDCGP